jgi:septal ring factor EnvC (AmiA/AmiB activator)
MAQSQTIAEQGRQLDAARQATGQEACATDAALRALQQELASGQHMQSQLQRDVKQLQALASEKDGRLAEAAAAEQRLRQQLEHAREQLQQHGACAAGASSRSLSDCPVPQHSRHNRARVHARRLPACPQVTCGASSRSACSSKCRS